DLQSTLASRVLPLEGFVSFFASEPARDQGDQAFVRRFAEEGALYRPEPPPHSRSAEYNLVIPSARMSFHDSIDLPSIEELPTELIKHAKNRGDWSALNCDLRNDARSEIVWHWLFGFGGDMNAWPYPGNAVGVCHLARFGHDDGSTGFYWGDNQERHFFIP